MLDCHPLCDSRSSSGSAHKKSSSDRFDGAMVGSDCYITSYNDQSAAECRDCRLRRHPTPPKKRKLLPSKPDPDVEMSPPAEDLGVIITPIIARWPHHNNVLKELLGDYPQVETTSHSNGSHLEFWPRSRFELETIMDYLRDNHITIRWPPTRHEKRQPRAPLLPQPAQEDPENEERNVVPTPTPSTSRNQEKQEVHRNSRLPSTGKNVGNLPTYPTISSSPTPYADTKKTLADRPTNPVIHRRPTTLRQLQILPARANPAKYPMPTITMIPGEGEVQLCKSLQAKLAKRVPVHFTRGGNHAHYNPASVEEYYVIWDHLSEHNANILRRENHQQALLSRTLLHSTMESRASSTTLPTLSAAASHEATPQHTATPSMSANTSRSVSPTQTPTSSMSADTPCSGSPTRTPVPETSRTSSARSWPRPQMTTQTPTPRMSANPSRDVSPTRTPTPNHAKAHALPSTAEA
ncbi:hypothetical protein ACJJTC_017328 [Scirpophaga incertulas]